MNRLERTVVLTAALMVLGGVVSLPSVLAHSFMTGLALLLPAGVSLLVPAIHKTDGQSPGTLQLIAEASAPWVGYAIAFHNRYGSWDYQGVWIGVFGAVIMSLIVIARTRRGREGTATQGRFEQSATADRPRE
jgi:hypothetical protein